MVLFNVLRCTVIALALCLATTGCGLKAGYEDSKKTEVAIKDELGIEARVQFRTLTSSANGTHTLVTVIVREPQAGDGREFRATIVEIVKRTFRSKVDRIDVVF